MKLSRTRSCTQTTSPWAAWQPCWRSVCARPKPNRFAPIDLLSCLVSDELALRGERLLERRKKQAQFRDSHKTLDNFDFNFNKKMNRSLVFDLAAGAFIARHEDALFLGPPGTGQEPLGPGHRPGRNPTGLSRALPRNSYPAG